MKKFANVYLPVALALVLMLSLGAFAQSPALHDIRPGYGVTGIGWLSDYHPALKGTPGDTRVYYLDSGVPGGTVYVQGGTHGNEIAGVIAAVVLVEKAVPTTGKLIVVPHGNNANVDYNDGSFSDVPETFELDAKDGITRVFRYGSRRTNPEYEALSDPRTYFSPSGGEALNGGEIRNLNRVHPGKEDGTLTEQIAYGIRRLLIEEDVDVAFDLHEASVGSRLENTLVVHPDAMEIGVLSVLYSSMEGLHFNLEPSQEEFRGLSHREWGDHTQVLSVLTETGNPGMTGSIANPDVVWDATHPLHDRVGRQLTLVTTIIEGAMDLGMASMTMDGVPTYADIMQAGSLSPWLNGSSANR